MADDASLSRPHSVSPMIDVGIIGGTGIGSRLLSLPGEPLELSTEYGHVSAHVVTHEGIRIAVLSRHAAGHKVTPHRVNYRATAAAMRDLKVKGVFATAAVGSLRPDWGPGTLALCSDFLDLSARNVTMFDTVIGHTDFSEPFSSTLREAVLASGHELPIQRDAIYLNLNGPRYETPAEVRLFGSWGADVVGMTAGSEAVVMREAGVPYACLAVVTNLGTGLSPTALHHGEVEDVMGASGGAVVDLLLRAATRLR